MVTGLERHLRLHAHRPTTEDPSDVADQRVELGGTDHGHWQPAPFQDELTGVLGPLIGIRVAVAADDRDVDHVRLVRPVAQDLDHSPGAVQVDRAIARPVAGRVHDHVGALQHAPEPLARTQVDSGPPTGHDHLVVAVPESGHHLPAQATRPAGDHDVHLLTLSQSRRVPQTCSDQEGTVSVEPPTGCLRRPRPGLPAARAALPRKPRCRPSHRHQHPPPGISA